MANLPERQTQSTPTTPYNTSPHLPPPPLFTQGTGGAEGVQGAQSPAEQSATTGARGLVLSGSMQQTVRGQASGTQHSQAPGALMQQALAAQQGQAPTTQAGQVSSAPPSVAAQQALGSGAPAPQPNPQPTTHPTTNGDHGRDTRSGMPEATRGLPSAHQSPPTPPPPQPAPFGDNGVQALLDALLEIRDAQIRVKDELTEVKQRTTDQEKRLQTIQEERPKSHSTPILPKNLQPAFSPHPSRGEPSPLVSRQAHQLANGRWELGSEFHSAMVKSAPTMVTKLKKDANYESFKAWLSAVDDWVFSHTQVLPDDLGPTAVRSVARMTLTAELYSVLENGGALGNRSGTGEPASWPKMIEHLRERLSCSSANLKLGLAMMKQGDWNMADYAQEFERRARDAEMSEESAKVLLVGTLNKDTLVRLDTYVTTAFAGEVTGRETQLERLARISYPSMLAFLKQGSLSALATSGSKQSTLPGVGSNAVDAQEAPSYSGFTAAGVMTTATEEAPAYSGFTAAGVMTVTPSDDKKPEAPAKGKKPKKNYGRKNKGPSNPKTPGEYTPEPVPARDELMKVFSVGIATADQVFPPEVCKDPLPMLAAVIGVLGESEANPNLPDSSKQNVISAIRFLSERLATIQALVDPSTPSVNAANLFPSGTDRRGPARTMMYDIARGLARRVPLTKLVALDGDVRPYLASLMVAAIHRAGDELTIPRGTRIKELSKEQFENFLKAEAGRSYDNYGMIADELFKGKQLSPGEQDRIQRERLETLMEKVEKAIRHSNGDYSSDEDDDTEMKGGPTANNIEALLKSAQGAALAKLVDGVAKKVEDNIVKTITAAAATANGQSVGASPGSTNIKQVRRASGKLLSAKPVGTPPPQFQPHIEVSVAPTGATQPSKWGTDIKAQPTKGHMMVDTGAAVTMVTKRWAELHGLKVSNDKRVTIRGAGGQNVEVIGTTAFTVQLAPTLEMDVADVVVSEGELYQALLGGDLLKGKPGILGPATITMPGLNHQGAVQWKVEKQGCIAVADFLAPTATNNSVLPKPPPPAKEQPKDTTFEAEGVRMDKASKDKLKALAKERDAQLKENAPAEKWQDLLRRARQLFRDSALPINLSRLLSQVFYHRLAKPVTCETVLAKTLAKAQKSGYEAGVQELESFGLPAPTPFLPRS